jgi:hypothetical protein
MYIYVMKFGWLALSVLCITPMVWAQSAQKPNFSGTWILNLQKSTLEVWDQPIAATFIIQHHESEFHLKRTHIYRDGERDTWSHDLITDGRHKEVQNEGTIREVTRMYWDGDVLVLDMKSTATDGSTGTNVVRYSLSVDGNTMTTIEREDFPGGRRTNLWVYDREVTPKPAID